MSRFQDQNKSNKIARILMKQLLYFDIHQCYRGTEMTAFTKSFTNNKKHFRRNIENLLSKLLSSLAQSWQWIFYISSETLLLTSNKSFKLVRCFTLFVNVLVKALIFLLRWHWWMSKYTSYFIKILFVLLFCHLFGLSFYSPYA